MKVLEITFIPPDRMSGGGRGILQSIKSILANSQMDYIGPEFDLTILEPSYKKNLGKMHFLKQCNRNFVTALRGIIDGASTSFYDSWLKASMNIDWSEYECVHIESSRYDFVVECAKKYKKPIIIRLHNIESDYGKNAFMCSGSVKDYIRYTIFKYNERRCIRKADWLVFITQADLKRAEKLYGYMGDNYINNPVCMEENEYTIKSYKKEEIVFLTTGSLSFGPNLYGVKWFLENVWNGFIEENINARFIVAGSHPTDDLKKIIENIHGVELVDTPRDMMEYLRVADVYIAPIFDGAGMKVKVAEALSFGLPVIGTNHAWIGYEKVKFGRYIANTTDEFIKTMKELNEMYTVKIHRRQIRDEFNLEYSTKASETRYRELFRRIGGKF